MVNPIRKSSELLSKNIFRLQYASDLHLELNKINDFSKIIKPIAPFLALVGDIGHISTPSYKPFFDYVSKEFEQVYYVPGNHEYKSFPKSNNSENYKTLYQLNYQMKKFCDSYNNIHYLYRNSIKLDNFNVGIIGSSLWTPYFSSKQIYVGIETNLCQQYSNHLHQLDLTYINEKCQMFKNTNTKLIVLTHFLPSFSLISNKYKNMYINKIASDCDFLFDFPIDYWIYGHSHQSAHTFINKTMCISNPYGYRYQYLINGFCNQMFIEFKLSTNEEEDRNTNLPFIIEDYHLYSV